MGIKTRDLAFVFVKLFGIFIFIRGLKDLFDGIMVWSVTLVPLQQNYNISVSQSKMIIMSLIGQLIYCVVQIGLSYILWVKTEKVVKYIIPKEDVAVDNETGSGVISLENVQIAAFSVVGLVVLSKAIPDILYYGATVISNIKIWQDVYGMNIAGIPRIFNDIVRPLLYLIIGIALLLGSHGFLKILKRMKNWGQSSVEASSETHRAE